MATITSPRSASPAIPHITSPSPASTSNTPTSSVRPSIDLSANPPHQNPPTTNPNQRRNRAALRDYYNLKNKPTSAGGSGSNTLSRTSSITSTTSNSTTALTVTTTDGLSTSVLPASIDDPTFDADTYITSLLKTSSMKDILRAEGSLVSEIRNLDGERKALVYDNYSKLIVAVGTIGEMQRGIVKGEVDGSGLGRMRELEGKLDGLMNGFERLGGKGVAGSEAVKNTVEDRRVAKEERQKRELVKWVLEAPTRLEQLVNTGKREDAEKQWTEVHAVLEKWAGVKGVEDVKDKCKKVLEEEDNEGD